MSDIIEAQEKTSQIGKQELSRKGTHEQVLLDEKTIAEQIHQYQGESCMYAEYGDAKNDFQQPVQGRNTSYSLWSVKRKSDQNLQLKQEPKSKQKGQYNPLVIMVRSLSLIHI